MGVFQVNHDGSFKFIEAFLKAMKKEEYILKVLKAYGELGVSQLAAATPSDTGYTAAMWSYEITAEEGRYSIAWTNDNTVNGTPLVIMLQYGHGTGTGGYVQGRDFINPAIMPIFEDIAKNVWKEVTSA